MDMIESAKPCSKCREYKPFEQFYKQSKAYDGLTSACKECVNKQQKQKRDHRTPEEIAQHKQYQKGYHQRPEVKAKAKEKQQQKRKPKKPKQDNKTRNKKATLKRLYGLTLEEFQEMKETHNYRCAICNIHESELPQDGEVSKNLHIDHCHATNKIRGLLCYSCNFGLGRAKDSVEILRKAKQYLQDCDE